tara:strand:- start:41152 stop:42405 length:1254 start_codon:yes stop_codon:yes gene_type:complete
MMHKTTRILFYLFLGTLFFNSCKNEKSTATKETSFYLETGTWRTVLTVQDEKELPFILEVKNDSTFIVKNAEERIFVDEVIIEGDSIIIKMPVFEGVFKGKINSSKNITGNFIKASLDRVVPFKMIYNELNRFEVTNDSPIIISENWETVFSPDTKEDKYIAKGIFKQEGNIITGTFRTTTGDYRYLEGVVDGNQLKLSTFDGAHAFLFEATVTDSTMVGSFYSGNHWKEPFIAKRNDTYELPSASSLTYLKEGYESIEFSFPNTKGKMVSLEDDVYKNKVVIVQVMGTWCPNCLDETKYYAQFYKEHQNEDVEFIALAFEYKRTEEKAFNAITRLKEKVGVTYPILLAQYGTSNKKKANEKLPMLNHVLSYPTTIFIDKKGKVRKIHTGFNGPATGEKYIAFKKEFELFVNELLGE